MAFLVIGAARFAVKGIKDGIQAHKDAQDPTFAEREQAVQMDRWGNPKKPGPVYGWVMKAEQQRKGKAGAESGIVTGGESRLPVAYGRSEGQERSSIDKGAIPLQSEDYGPQDYSAKGFNTTGEAPPPSYDEAVTPTTSRLPKEAYFNGSTTAQPRSGFGAVQTTSTSSQLPSRSMTRPLDRRRSSSSSSSSTSSSSSGHPSNSSDRATRRLGRKERKSQRRQDKAERRALKREHREERSRMKAQQRYDRSLARLT